MGADLESRVAEWRAYLSRRAALRTDDVDELEAHLRDQIDGLVQRGLSSDEAFLIGVGRIGRIDELAREYATEHSDRLWKQLIADGHARDWTNGCQLIDLFGTFPISLDAERLRALTRPLAPRAYSIASSRKAHRRAWWRSVAMPANCRFVARSG